MCVLVTCVPFISVPRTRHSTLCYSRPTVASNAFPIIKTQIYHVATSNEHYNDDDDDDDADDDADEFVRYPASAACQRRAEWNVLVVC